MKKSSFYRYIYSSLSVLNKDQLVTYIPGVKKSTTKSNLIEMIRNKIESGELDIERIYEENEEEFALTSNQLEITLEVQKAFLGWIKKNRKVEVVRTELIYKYGENIEVPYWDAKTVLNLVDNKKGLKELEKEYKEEKDTLKRAGIEKAKVTKSMNNDLRSTYDLKHKELLAEWSAKDKEGALYLEVAFWVMWASRWAKVYAEKYKKSKKWTELDKSKEYYDLKEHALKVIGMSKYAHISLYEPERADKVFIELCEEHRLDWRYSEHPSNVVEFYYKNRDVIDECDGCFVSCEENYYSLFHIKIIVEGVEEKFSFHMPYTIGVKLFKNIPLKKEKDVQENKDSMFRFGRPLFDEEQVILTESKVKKSLEKALQAIKEG